MSKVARFALTVAVFIAVAVEAGAHPVITRMSDRQNVTLQEVAAVAANSDVILIGESHDIKEHHELQLDLLRSLLAKKLQLAIGVEMIETSDQRQLDEWSAGRLSEAQMQAVFERNWSEWALYRDIFVFARDNRIPMVALNVPLPIVRKVSQYGFASLTPEEKGGLPEGTKCDLTNPQIAVLRKSFRAIAAHVGQGKAFNNFCEAQTVRNSGMAIRLAHYVEQHPGQKIVGLAGIWHAVKYAIPDQLEHYTRKLSCTVILPETPELSVKDSGTSEADYLVEL